MTKIKANTTKLDLASTKTKPKLKSFALPASVHPSLQGDFDSLTKSLQLAGAWKDTMMGSVESYLISLFMLREASKAVYKFGLLDEHGDETAAAKLLARALPQVKAQALSLGLTTLAQSKGSKQDEPSEAEKAKAQTNNPWLNALGD